MTKELEIIKNKWNEILNMVREIETIADVAYDLWIAPLKPYDILEDRLIVLVDKKQFLDIINKRFKQTLRIAILDVTEINKEILFIDESGLDSLYKEDKKEELSFSDALKNANLNSRYTFDSFVVGSSNDLAHAACVAVAELPGEQYNPLYIYGGAGLGKTHLMQSVAHFILQQNRNAKIRYVTSETFINEFVDSIRNKNNISPAEFRKKYRELDVLLIDDIQFLIGKEGTQEEFFHTFNALYDNRKQIIIASDKPPKDIDNLEERLRSRFEVGLIVDIQMPDVETRMAILRKKEELEGYNIDNEVIKYIADNIKSNVRELEGALTKVVAKSRLVKQPITLTLAEDLLKDHITPSERREITADVIIEIVAEHYNLNRSELASPTKKKNIAYPRQIAMYLCREMTDVPLVTVGELLGGRDHSTVIHGCDRISTDLRTNEQLQSTIENLRKKIAR
ncbi:chromosomal replication initiator protein DnaA [Oribacterium asaccharolyticum ACB7]|jgi:chromosomal replication initiator protein dnaA|uniref:Chromosomal replication initiator protein DnaA n=1 Tax=Oribacterium asaccharolyticum ACB7 TaxID=796944 RepID=G9WSZ7_9FIRM|nr:chromosomal replication initiator protein DnaA [Oribacterium asaccharolyticum]EHL13367.1 chromosomal replication initiator protein DnaA [Oribacterium asaccharolyticum ACB7]